MYWSCQWCYQLNFIEMHWSIEWRWTAHRAIFIFRALKTSTCQNLKMCQDVLKCGYGSIPIDTFLVRRTSIYQLFWGSLGTRVLTHPHVSKSAIGRGAKQRSGVVQGYEDVLHTKSHCKFFVSRKFPQVSSLKHIIHAIPVDKSYYKHHTLKAGTVGQCWRHPKTPTWKSYGVISFKLIASTDPVHDSKFVSLWSRPCFTKSV